jgi:hypothetical protein
MTNNAVAVIDRPPASTQAVSAWQSPASFEAAQRMAKALVNSPLVPVAYQGDDNLGSAVIALDIAQRINASPLMVMQNLHIINGRPSWGASFIIGALNSCGLFSPLRFRVQDQGEQEVEFFEWTGSRQQNNLQKISKKLTIRNKTCIASCVEKVTGEILEGPEVSVAMAVAEGWYNRRDSKWPTMTDLMLRYRAAAFFGRLYAPDLLMGMQTAEEARDINDVDYAVVREVAPQAAEPAAETSTEEGKPRRAKGVAAAMKAPAADEAAKAAPAPAKADPVKVSSGAKPAQAKAPDTVVDAEVVNERQDEGGDDEGRFGGGYDEQDGDAI